MTSPTAVTSPPFELVAGYPNIDEQRGDELANGVLSLIAQVADAVGAFEDVDDDLLILQLRKWHFQIFEVSRLKAMHRCTLFHSTAHNLMLSISQEVKEILRQYQLSIRDQCLDVLVKSHWLIDECHRKRMSQHARPRHGENRIGGHEACRGVV